jgi:hypothetical protein
MDAPRYQPFFCEENVWHLCADPRVPPAPRAVLFVSNRDRTVAFLQQRAGRADTPVVWDYHVVLVVRGDAQWWVWDLDTRLPLPVPLSRWLEESFALPRGFPPPFAPRFRVVEAEQYRAGFRSDRSHMRGPDGAWRADPPPWPAILGGAHDLSRYVDLEQPDPGRVADLDALLTTLDDVTRQSSKSP